MIEKRLIVGAFHTNCWLVACPKTKLAVVIDAGDEPAKILAAIADGGFSVTHLLHTHGHLDHAGATRPVKEALASKQAKAPKIAISKADEPLYKELKTQGAYFGLSFEDPLPVDEYLEDGQVIKVGCLSFKVLSLPGHSPGGVGFLVTEEGGSKEATLYSGDTIFKSSVGRTDLWGGNQEDLIRSIQDKVLTLPGPTRLCPGHGSETSAEAERDVLSIF
jgi:hydroxyacylglutathione hydrolase